jgi:hypothetical protein
LTIKNRRNNIPKKTINKGIKNDYEFQIIF